MDGGDWYQLGHREWDELCRCATFGLGDWDDLCWGRDGNNLRCLDFAGCTVCGLLPQLLHHVLGELTVVER